MRERARITDLFPQADLQRRGAEFLTLCPWHRDSNASRTVSPRTNRLHCFVCNKGADPIGWLQDRQGLSFREVVEELARSYAIPLPEQDPEAAALAEAERQERQPLRRWRSQQEEEFHQALISDLGASGTAASYLEQRGISPETAIAWRLGLNGSRLMLPIRDAMGRCCGFSGRSLNAEEPKYRNSSGDLLFQKSQLLFGLDRGAGAIRRSGEALLVEGPLDVIQLHQAGLDNAVAALGTAVTIEQLQRLQRSGTKRLWLAYDGDNAGANATARLIGIARPLLLRGELDLLVVPVPPGEDPDSLLRSHGETATLRKDLEKLLTPYGFRAANDNVRHGYALGSAVCRRRGYARSRPWCSRPPDASPIPPPSPYSPNWSNAWPGPASMNPPRPCGSMPATGWSTPPWRGGNHWRHPVAPRRSSGPSPSGAGCCSSVFLVPAATAAPPSAMARANSGSGRCS